MSLLDKALNPFGKLSKAQEREVQRRKLQEFEAKERVTKLVEAYRQVVDDPRYAAIHEQLSDSLGDLLHALLELSKDCSRCGVKAAEIRLLNEVLMEPLHHRFLEAQRTRLQTLAESVE